MRGFKALVGVTALSLLGTVGVANAEIIIEFDSVVTGYTPGNGSDAPWLTTTINDGWNGNQSNTGVWINFSTTVTNPEFITDVYFALNGASN